MSAYDALSCLQYLCVAVAAGWRVETETGRGGCWAGRTGNGRLVGIAAQRAAEAARCDRERRGCWWSGTGGLTDLDGLCITRTLTMTAERASKREARVGQSRLPLWRPTSRADSRTTSRADNVSCVDERDRVRECMPVPEWQCCGGMS